MFTGKKALLLDMNGTFMFGEDRFGESEDFSEYYHEIGGSLPKPEINQIIRAVYHYLDKKYIDEAFRHCFPSVESAIEFVVDTNLPQREVTKIIDTFAFHELGHIPEEHVAALTKLRKRFLLAVVIDIWSPKYRWLSTFEKSGVSEMFSAQSFSSDHGIVKPSVKPFERVLKQLEIPKNEALVVGDSIRRDLGGAKAAGIDCVLVGGAIHPHAVASYNTLLEFSDTLSDEL